MSVGAAAAADPPDVSKFQKVVLGQGTGLGLSIARRLVALMGGELALASSPGAGALFSFELDAGIAELQALRGMDTVREVTSVMRVEGVAE